jgi:uncharacterized protein YecT (DUF1311 family)
MPISLKRNSLLLCAVMIAAYPSTSRSDPSLGEASCGQQSSVTIEIVECLNTELSKADDSLNKVYGLILRELAAGSIYPNESPFFADWKRDLVKTERAWAAFKDLQCLVEGELLEPGTGMSIQTASCLVDLTNQRIHFLDEFAGTASNYSKLCQSDEAKCKLPNQPP